MLLKRVDLPHDRRGRRPSPPSCLGESAFIGHRDKGLNPGKNIHIATFAQHATDLSENIRLSIMVPWLMFEE
jgi:hypothetical protein